MILRTGWPFTIPKPFKTSLDKSDAPILIYSQSVIEFVALILKFEMDDNV